jgi:hypothetical protein
MDLSAKVKKAQTVDQAMSHIETAFLDKLRILESVSKDIDNIRSTLDSLDEQHDVYAEEASALNYLVSTVEIGLTDILENFDIEKILTRS